MKFSMHQSPEATARAEARYADRECGCPAKLVCAISEENPQGHHADCPLWGTDKVDLTA